MHIYACIFPIELESETTSRLWIFESNIIMQHNRQVFSKILVAFVVNRVKSMFFSEWVNSNEKKATHFLFYNNKINNYCCNWMRANQNARSMNVSKITRIFLIDTQPMRFEYTKQQQKVFTRKNWSLPNIYRLYTSILGML